MKVYTIGHSNLDLQAFIDLLMRYGIGVVVDVRSQPYSQYAIQYNREPFKAALMKSGLDYVFAGEELGGRPRGDEYYDEQGRVLYGKYRFSDKFQEGISKLKSIAENKQPVILCSEENPAICHRKLLIGRYLSEQGEEILHIRSDGSVVTDAEVNVGSAEEDSAQIGLFGLEETLDWKSIRSVSPKKARKNSEITEKIDNGNSAIE